VNGASTKLGLIHTDVLPTMGDVAVNDKSDVKTVWMDSTVDADGEAWLYFAWERVGDTGASVVMYEFQQKPRPGACAYGTATPAQLAASCNPWANRSSGDFVIVFDYQGGVVPVISRRTYTGAAPALVLGPVELITDSTVVRGRANGSGTKGEAAINLSQTVFKGVTASCTSVANVIPFTATGNSDTADFMDVVLGDFAATTISNCGTLNLTKVTQAPGGVGTFPVTVARKNGDPVHLDGRRAARSTSSATAARGASPRSDPRRTS
jgi:hypothetical protein